MRKSNPKKDPFYKREAKSYDEPIVSRELIMAEIKKANKPVSMEALLSMFSMSSDKEKEALRRRLRAMIRDGQLHCNKSGEFLLIDQSTRLDGIVEIYRDGFGRVFIPEDERYIALSQTQLKLVFPGDRVLVTIMGVGDDGKLKGAIAKIVKRAHSSLIGRFHRAAGVNYVVPENTNIHHDIMVLDADSLGAKEAQFVSVKITTWPTERTQALGKVQKILGDSLSSDLAIEVAKKAFDLPDVWPTELLNEVNALPKAVGAIKEPDRKDLSQLPFITIDGEDAMDFDDAVYATKEKAGFKLYVAIADVSHYVSFDAPLDLEAKKRGTSVYFPNHVLPMLPEVLSNDLCSLKPDVPRLTLVCEMHIDDSGQLASFSFYKGMIHSQARLTYNEVAKYLSSGSFDTKALPEAVTTSIDTLNQLYHRLLLARESRGALAFNSVDTRIVLNSAHQVDKIIASERNDAHKLIEECMLVANVAAAKFILKHKAGGLFRVHDAPEADRMANLRDFLSFKGVKLKGGATPSVKDLNDALKTFDGQDDQSIAENVVLRSMQQAMYTPENVGHYGLGYDAYAHFTSPIRRYPDLVVHRVIKQLLSKEDKQGHVYSDDVLTKLGFSTSFMERRAEEASRDVEKSLKCAYMADKVGQDYAGVISGVTKFGFFVTLPSLLVDGLVHCRYLRDDYYIFDEKHQILRGDRTGRKFQFGDEVKVRVAKVDLSDRKIDFELTDDPLNSKTRSKSSSNQKRDTAKPKSWKKTKKAKKKFVKHKADTNGKGSSPSRAQRKKQKMRKNGKDVK